jgi:diguanylate cyclase (GGDEF)-like protein
VAAEWTGDDRSRVPALTVRCLAQATGHAALALRHLALLAEVEALATTDPLTGIANRRVFDDELDRELHRSRRLGDPVTVVLLDADHFKGINDQHGHVAGDAVLCAIASALRSNTKAFDVVARVGGDEFAVVLPTCPPEAGAGVANRLCAAVAAAGVDPTVTVSAGWATFPDHADDRAGLLSAADAALYRAKRAGRARVGSPLETDSTVRSLHSAG